MGKKSVGGGFGSVIPGLGGLGGLPSFAFTSGPAVSGARSETGVSLGGLGTGDFVVGSGSISKSPIDTNMLLLIAGGLGVLWLLQRK